MSGPAMSGPAMSGLREALRAARPVLTAELGPPRDADPDAVTRKAGLLRGWVDAANVTDNQDQILISDRGEVRRVRREFQRPRQLRVLASIKF